MASVVTVTARPRPNVRGITKAVADLKKKMGIANPIQIQIVETNPRGLSVQPSTEPHGGFLLLIDAHFLSRLDNVELKAALAHELGHVWIYTHHPYLQTEELANRIAMRTVTRNSLLRLYAALDAFEGTASSVDRIPGGESTGAKAAVEKHSSR